MWDGKTIYTKSCLSHPYSLTMRSELAPKKKYLRQLPDLPGKTSLPFTSKYS